MPASPADPTGVAAHACGWGLGSAVPILEKRGFGVGMALKVSQALSLLSEGGRVFARIQLVDDRSARRLVLMDRDAVRFMLNTEGDHDATCRFTLDADGDLILEP